MSTSTVNSPPQRSRFGSLIRQLWFQVILGAVLGIAVGVLLPDVGRALTPLNDWFIGLVKMIVVPVVFCVVTLGIATMDSLRRAGRIGVKALGYFLVLSLVSMLIGLIVANIFKPGAGMNIDVSSLDASKIPGVDSGEKVGFVQFVTNVIPDSLFGAITGHAILSALLVSLLFGCALNVTDANPVLRSPRQSRRCHTSCSRSSAGSCGWRPIGTFGALASVVAKYGASSLQQLGFLILLFTATCIIYVVVHPRPDLPGLRTEPVHPDALLQDRTAHRAEHLLQRGDPAAAGAQARTPRRRQAPSSAWSSRPGSRSTSTDPRST